VIGVVPQNHPFIHQYAKFIRLRKAFVKCFLLGNPVSNQRLNISWLGKQDANTEAVETDAIDG
jgi:hypothetical protein